MAIKWLCTGKSQHVYQFKDANDAIQNAMVVAIDFKAEIDTENASGAVNELYETKPVLTEAGVEAFVGLQVYPQGFTVYLDSRITNQNATDVVGINDVSLDVATFVNSAVGSYLGTGAEPPLA